MRMKHLLTLKHKKDPPSCKNLTTYWLTIHIQQVHQRIHFLMDNNRTKTLNDKKPIYYNGIINYIKNQNKNIHKTKPETKITNQKIIQERTKQHTIAGEIQWKKQLPNINFKKIWKNTYKSYRQSCTKDLHYRLLHYSTKTKLFMHKRSLRTDGRQPIPIYTLRKNKKIWNYYQTILKKLTGQHYTRQKYLFTLNVPNTNKYTTKLTITIIQIILFEIRQSRNNNKYE